MVEGGAPVSGVRILTARGRLTAAGAEITESAIAVLAGMGNRRICVDLANVSELHADAMTSLSLLSKSLGRIGVSVGFAGAAGRPYIWYEAPPAWRGPVHSEDEGRTDMEGES
jgi:hypothetical protein